MPSYRVTLAVGTLQPGADPAAVLPAAADAARELATVEAWDVGVVRGQARITVRFMADTDGDAHQVAEHVQDAVDRLADTWGTRVTRRWGNRWHPA
ncbi:hypothetical protein DNL40_07525 [Xylanimonas oleitrophica]|uniref:Uncharacterized protein n=1 Tax=Xylanimonas oleitrophica TaxID=2607479 RepID=A0A2W5WR32_9MICO|nr:hypothetical protein [Xylanimonas oleitrophica]PZR53362.1 hypothetical protein DNL40_07525 [Xylanimonas oleitrophica]